MKRCLLLMLALATVAGSYAVTFRIDPKNSLWSDPNYTDRVGYLEESITIENPEVVGDFFAFVHEGRRVFIRQIYCKAEPYDLYRLVQQPDEGRAYLRKTLWFGSRKYLELYYDADRRLCCQVAEGDLYTFYDGYKALGSCRIGRRREYIDTDERVDSLHVIGTLARLGLREDTDYPKGYDAEGRLIRLLSGKEPVAITYDFELDTPTRERLAQLRAETLRYFDQKNDSTVNGLKRILIAAFSIIGLLLAVYGICYVLAYPRIRMAWHRLAGEEFLGEKRLNRKIFKGLLPFLLFLTPYVVMRPDPQGPQFYFWCFLYLSLGVLAALAYIHKVAPRFSSKRPRRAVVVEGYFGWLTFMAVLGIASMLIQLALLLVACVLAVCLSWAMISGSWGGGLSRAAAGAGSGQEAVGVCQTCYHKDHCDRSSLTAFGKCFHYRHEALGS